MRCHSTQDFGLLLRAALAALPVGSTECCITYPSITAGIPECSGTNHLCLKMGANSSTFGTLAEQQAFSTVDEIRHSIHRHNQGRCCEPRVLLGGGSGNRGRHGGKELGKKRVILRCYRQQNEINRCQLANKGKSKNDPSRVVPQVLCIGIVTALKQSHHADYVTTKVVDHSPSCRPVPIESVSRFGKASSESTSAPPSRAPKRNLSNMPPSAMASYVRQSVAADLSLKTDQVRGLVAEKMRVPRNEVSYSAALAVRRKCIADYMGSHAAQHATAVPRGELLKKHDPDTRVFYKFFADEVPLHLLADHPCYGLAKASTYSWGWHQHLWS